MEKLIFWFTRNHVAANFLMVVILVVGIGTWFKLRKEIFPETAIDAVTISVPYPNASPDEVEKGVILPIEEAIDGIDGIKRVTSTAAQNVAAVTVEVETGYNVRNVMDDIKTRVDAITNLAEEAEEPVLQELLLKGRVLQMALSGETDERTLRSLAETIREGLLVYEHSPDLPKFPPAAFFLKVMGRDGPFSVSQVNLSGGVRPYEIGIEVSEETLRSYGLTLDQVANAVRASSLDLPGGSIKTDGGEVLIRTESKRYRAEEFEDITVITRPDGSRVPLRDIASIVDGFEEVDVEVQFDDRRAILIDVLRTGEEDTLTLANATKAFIAERAPEILPPGVTLEVWADDSIFLKGRLELLQRNLAVGLLLVLIVLALFLRPSLALLVTIGIPVSFAGAVFTMPNTGISINMISLFAFILVLGIVVDDAIVVAENVYSRMRRGEHPRDAAPNGTHEVGVVVTFGVLTTAVAFTPMLGLSGVSGKIWPNIPWVVIPVLLFSLVQSKLILPAHLACLKPTDLTKEPTGIMKVQHRIARSLEVFVERVYRPVLRVILGYRYVLLCAFIMLFGITITAIKDGWIKFQFFPEVEADVVLAKINLPAGVPYETTKAAVDQMERALVELDRQVMEETGKPLIKHRVSSSGSQPFLQGFDAIGGVPIDSRLGEVSVEMYPAVDRDVNAQEVASRWRELCGPIPGAVALTFQAQGAAGGNAIDLEIAGPNIEDLEKATKMVTDALAEYAGVIDISTSNEAGKRQLQLDITDQGEALGLRLGDVSRQVRQGFYGEEVQRLQRGKDEVKVMVRYPKSERETLANLSAMKIRIPNQQGGPPIEVPFSEVATASFGRSYAKIQHSDGRRSFNVTADIDKTTKANANQVVASLTAVAKPLDKRDEFINRIRAWRGKELIEPTKDGVLSEIRKLYPGVTLGFQGEQRDQASSVSEMRRGFILALLIMYVLMAIPLGSYTQPLIVMSVIPFGMIGAVAGHVLMRTELSIMSMCGIVALAGVVVNDSLVLVDYVNREIERGKSIVEAAWEAGAARFRPILLTSLTTFAGLSPMLLETDMQAKFLIPMAISLGFGILFATLITLFLVPCVYLMMGDLKSFLGRRFGKKVAAS